MTAIRISTIRRIALAVGLALSASTVAASSSFAYSANARQMCTGDAFRLCSSEIPDIARIIACMRRNKASLSPGCRAVMDQEDTAATRTKPAQTAPVVQKPSIATPVEQPVATETKPAQTAPIVQKPTVATPVEQPAATETKPAQTAPVAQKPSVTTPVEQPAATETKPVQTAPVAQRPSLSTPVEVKPVQANSASRGKSAKLARHKKRPRQLIVERHIHRDFRNIGRAFGFALPIPLVIELYW
jgi:hypothetical protein